MTLRTWPFCISALLLLALAGCGEAAPGPDENLDLDGDGISNEHEGWDPVFETGVDTDDDGLPDALDLDSDDDSLLDALEAGDDSLETLPFDSDEDGTPDWRDTDSDDNGIGDAQEGTTDVDGDGVRDFADLDDDDDGVSDVVELAGVLDFPIDSDRDLSPDYQDPDSDNDLILDGHDGQFDADLDELNNRVDTDSDGDTILDRDEAGDDSLDTYPVDTDLDGAPDFLDLDSDGDSLPDAQEAMLGTNPQLTDSDDDGVDDLIETAAGTDATDPDDNPQARGDFVFIMPFREQAIPRRDTLDFRTNIQFADVYFAFDNSTSMSTLITEAKDATVTVLDELTCEDLGRTCVGDGECGEGVCSAEGRCIADPRITGCIASLWTGTGTFSSSCGEHHRYVNEQSLQPEAQVTADAISDETLGGTEDHYRTMACIADPRWCDRNSACSTTGDIGCPGFREDAYRVLVMFSDENNNCLTDFNVPCDEVNTPQAAGALLEEQGIVFVGVNAAESGSVEHQDLDGLYYDVGTISRSLGEDNQPIIIDAESAEQAGPVIAAAVREVTQNVRQLVNAEAEEVDDDAGDALQFIERLETNVNGVEPCTFVENTVDLNTDGYDDAYAGLLPGVSVCWDVVARDNFTVEPTQEPQVFRALIVVRGTGNTILDTRNVWFLVPPVIEDVPLE